MGFLKDLGNSLLGGIPSMIGNAVGAISNNSTNKANKEINQMNNEFNERMMDKQIAYEQEMWQKNNEYNSASAQAQRWREAGFNPSMMMGNANAGVATSGSVGAASAAPSAPQQAFRPDVSSFIQGIASMKDLAIRDKLADAEANQLGSQTERNKAEAAALAEDVIGKKAFNKYAEENAKLDYEMKIQEKEARKKEMELNDLMISYQSMVNNGFNEYQAAQIAMYKAYAVQSEFNSQSEIDKVIDSMEKELGFEVPNYLRGFLYLLFGFSNFVPKQLPITIHKENRNDYGPRNTTINNNNRN